MGDVSRIIARRNTSADPVRICIQIEKLEKKSEKADRPGKENGLTAQVSSRA